MGTGDGVEPGGGSSRCRTRGWLCRRRHRVCRAADHGPGELDQLGLRHDSTPRCYGCGVAVQSDTPDHLGYVSRETLVVKRRHNQLGQLYCTRCQELCHGRLIPAVASLPGAQPSAENLLDPARFREIVSQIRGIRALVVLLIDVLDVSGSALARIRDLGGRNPILVVGTKLDLLPAVAEPPGVLAAWLRDFLLQKGIVPIGIRLVSSKTGAGIREAARSIIHERHGRDVYVVGAANVGKSLFLRALVRELAAMESPSFDPKARLPGKRLPTTANIPGTTLDLIRLPVFSSGGALVDTPGIHVPHRLLHAPGAGPLPPLQRLVGRTFDLGDGREHRFSWGRGQISVSIGPCPGQPPPYQVAFYGPLAMKPVPEEADGATLGSDVRSREADSRPPAERRQTHIFEKHIGPGNRRGAPCAVADVVVSGFPGWIQLTTTAVTKVRIQVTVPTGVQAFVRAPMPLRAARSTSRAA